MKPKRPFRIIACVFMLVLLSTSIYGHLYHQTNHDGLLNGDFTPRLTSGPNGVKYYMSSYSIPSTYSSYISQGVESWDSSNYEINLVLTTTYSESLVDVKGYDGSLAANIDHADVFGYTLVVCGDGPYQSNNDSSLIPSDYWGAEVYLNYYGISNTTDYTSPVSKRFKVITAHEVGHALGCGHVTGTSNLMYQSFRDTQNTPQNSDKLLITILYLFNFSTYFITNLTII